jgi:hypothetical protein
VNNCLDFWDPVLSAFGCILDAMPLEQQTRAIEQLQLMATVQANRGDQAAEYFCRALAGEEYPNSEAIASSQQGPEATKHHGHASPLQFSRFRAIQGGAPKPKDDNA